MFYLFRIKLIRQEQTYLMKKQRTLASETRAEIDLLWDLVILILAREKQMHGSTMIQGKEGGINSLKKQMGPFKLIRMQNVDEICNEYAKQYQFLKKKRPSVALQKSLENNSKPPVTPMDARNNNANLVKNDNAAKKPMNNSSVTKPNNIPAAAKDNKAKPTMNGATPQNKKLPPKPDSDSETSDSDGEEPEEVESPEPEKEENPELSDKEIADLCANTEKMLEEAKLRRQKKAEERKKLLEEQSKLEKELEYKARRLKEAFIVDDEDDGTVELDDNDPIAPHSKLTSSLMFGTNSKPSVSTKAEVPSSSVNGNDSSSPSKTQRSYTRADPTPEYQRRIMESIMENELAMVQNEMGESKNSNLSTTNTDIATQNKVEKPVVNAFDKTKDKLSEKKIDVKTAPKENGVTTKNDPPKNNITNDSASILSLIQMVDNKIDKLKDESNKEDTKKIVANRAKDSINEDYQRRIMESIMENELAMAQNEIPKLETNPSSKKDNLANLSVNNKSNEVKSDETNGQKESIKVAPSIPNISLGKSPKPSPRDKSMKKSSSEDVTSNDAKVKGEDVPDASNESSYSQIMKYLKTQEEAEQKRNQNRIEENGENKDNLVTSIPTKPSRKSSGDSSSKNRINDTVIKNDIKDFNQDQKENKTSNDKVVENEGVPDKFGFRSVGTQTLRVRENKSCSCCCTCKNTS